MLQESNLNRKLKNYHNIKNLVNVYFTKTLSEYQLLNSRISSNLEEVGKLHNLYSSLDKKFKIKSMFFDGFKQLKKQSLNLTTKKRLIIYFAETARFSALSFNNLDQKIAKMFQPGDYLITIGNHAQDFAQENNLEVTKSYDQLDLSIAKDLKLYAYRLFITKAVYQIDVVLLSNRFKENHATILPINEYHTFSEPQEVDLEQVDLYPSLSEFTDYLNVIFLDLAFNNIIIEASFFNLKQKIIRLKSLLENIDTKIHATENAILKERRKISTEEIITTTQS